jgi:hypothetical protein
MVRVSALLLSILAAGAACAATVDEDVERYVAIFQGNDTALHNKSVEELAWKGISDPRLFDLLERRALAEHKAAEGVRAEKDRVARYIRALGFSGQEKYRPTLRFFENDPVYQRYARDALEQQPQYARWNPQISSRAGFVPGLSDDRNRVMNMIRSEDLMLARVGAKRAYFDPDDATLDLIAEKLRGRYQTSDPEHVDAVAWLVKALGKTRRHDALLEDVKANAPDRKVRNAADSALRHVR